MVASSVTKQLHISSIYFAQQLITFPSVTPCDAGCQSFIAEHLEQLGFCCQWLPRNGVTNLIARWGNGARHFAFSGHTDVVPPGPAQVWSHPPFAATIKNNILYGRGAADMKTGIAAMLAATQRAIAGMHPDKLTFWWLITSDAEGKAEDGTKWIKHYLDAQNISLDMCLVGEPTANDYTGDTLTVGRRGSLSGTLVITGQQGHVAYPQYSKNAIHVSTDICQTLRGIPWDPGTADLPGTSLQITHIDTDCFTDNMLPAGARIEFNIRYTPPYTHISIAALIEQHIYPIDADVRLSWSRPCHAYHSQARTKWCLIKLCEKAIYQATGRYPILSTAGGTSDGRFLASDKTQVVELGVPNRSIHQVDEHVHLSDLLTLEDIYCTILTELSLQAT